MPSSAQPSSQSLVPPTTHPVAAVLVSPATEVTCQKAETDQLGNEPRELPTASGEDQNGSLQNADIAS